MTENAKLTTIPTEDLINALNEAHNIEQILRLHYRSADHNNRSDADLYDICSRYLNKKINLFTHKMSWDGGSILAFYVAYPDKYDICLLDGLNYCYSKFALCKELFHIIIENPEFESINFDYTIDKCVNGGDLNGADSNEYIAEIAAMEYLFPFRIREMLIKGGDIDFDKVAADYRIPRLLVEKYLTDYRMDSLSECYKESLFSSN